MPVQALFGVSVLTSFVAFSIVAKLYIVPRLKVMPLEDALRCLIAPHMFRFVGLSFLVPGVVSPALSTSFAAPAAYGDQIAACYHCHRRTHNTRGLGCRVGVAIQPLGCRRSTLRILPRPNRRWYRSGGSRRGVLHSDTCRAASACHTCNDLLVAAAHRGTNGAVGDSRLLISNGRYWH